MLYVLDVVKPVNTVDELLTETLVSATFDLLLSHAVKAEETSLYVFLWPAASCSPSSSVVRTDILKMYDLLWEHMQRCNLQFLDSYVFPALSNKMRTLDRKEVLSESIRKTSESNFPSESSNSHSPSSSLPTVSFTIVETSETISKYPEWFLPPNSDLVEISKLENSRTALIRTTKFIDYSATEISAPLFRTVVVGGTFDQFHIGHKKLLSVCVNICSDRLIVGVTSDKMLHGKHGKTKANMDIVQSTEQRKASVRNFVHKVKGSSIILEVVAIDDPFGPTATEIDCHALVLSSETIKGGIAVNEKRRKNGLGPLALVLIPRNNSTTLSSSQLRELRAQM